MIAEIAHRREDGRARADGDPALAATKRTPCVGAFAVREGAVEHGNLVRKHRADPPHRLRRQRDFRNEHDRTAACRPAPA